MERQKAKEEQERKLLEARAQYIEKTKGLLKFEVMDDEMPSKSRSKGGKVNVFLQQLISQVPKKCLNNMLGNI